MENECPFIKELSAGLYLGELKRVQTFTSYVLNITFHLVIGLPSSICPLGSQIKMVKMVCIFLIFLIRTTCPTHLILLELFYLVRYNHWYEKR
jgi:hypothetical protein